ncbi:hypothetical protein DM02DRAFT_529709 [Periconia macrospinosa]|uniref:Zn(2)-C6 fungal-type domain-containing protein n=1 Tax=Periconia macrospinosa TaxID=97972 RepID=A0A2V1DMN5_9PLEO|nr:hypothetical protein DM02DRAFT_529709 [Periconia macrospinosa]
MPAQPSSTRSADDDRPAKRSRVSRACDQCRTAREKCDGAQPVCRTCSGLKRSCTYTAPPKKRGIQPGYIRTLELALTWLFQNTDGESLLNQKIAQEGNASILFGRETRESNRLHKSWRKTRFCRDVDRVLSGEQLPRDGRDAESPNIENDDSDAEAESMSLQNQPPMQPPEETNVSPTTHFASPTIPRPIHNQPTLPFEPTYSHVSLPAPTPLPANSWRLLELYFAYTQAWLPICEKHDILRTSYLYPEQGIVLSILELPNSHEHAELWSALAVAVHQAKLDPEYTCVLPDSERLYNITKSLIPTEVGHFETGHVKALLNLAVINIGSGRVEAAWLIIGSASRILTAIERKSEAPSSRFKHLFAGCFLMDSFLSLQLSRKPYLHRSDVDSIEEDGLEEWQPWTTPIASYTTVTPRTPTFGLSSFNKLLDLANLLVAFNCKQSDSAQFSSTQLLSSLEHWKAMLPTKLSYIVDEQKEIPVNPPALLLSTTYIYVLFVFRPSQTLVDRLLYLVERFRELLGVVSMPPLVDCLLSDMQRRDAYTEVEQRSKLRLEKIRAENVHAWSVDRQETSTTIARPRRPSSYQVPTPESIQIQSNPSFAQSSNRPHSARPRQSISLLEELLPDMNPAVSANRSTVGMTNMELASTQGNFPGHPLQHRSSLSKSTVPPELENFFDELASLDGTEKIDNQPQFMQNLGFAPDANMADFLATEFGQFIPGNSSTFLPQHDDYTHLDPAFFGAT